MFEESPEKGEIGLVVVSGKHQGARILLPLKIFTIGRGQRCHLRLASRSVSKVHCALAPHRRGLNVCDLKSRNGTFVNGQRIGGQTRLRHGDELCVGPVQFRVSVPRTLSSSGPLTKLRREIAWLWASDDDEVWHELDRSDETLPSSHRVEHPSDENGDHVAIAAGQLWTKTLGNGNGHSAGFFS